VALKLAWITIITIPLVTYITLTKLKKKPKKKRNGDRRKEKKKRKLIKTERKKGVNV
jgi:hypothetical protein